MRAIVAIQNGSVVLLLTQDDNETITVMLDSQTARSVGSGLIEAAERLTVIDTSWRQRDTGEN